MKRQGHLTGVSDAASDAVAGSESECDEVNKSFAALGSGMGCWPGCQGGGVALQNAVREARRASETGETTARTRGEVVKAPLSYSSLTRAARSGIVITFPTTPKNHEVPSAAALHCCHSESPDRSIVSLTAQAASSYSSQPPACLFHALPLRST